MERRGEADVADALAAGDTVRVRGGAVSPSSGSTSTASPATSGEPRRSGCASGPDRISTGDDRDGVCVDSVECDL
jgi:hypothetical protein